MTYLTLLFGFFLWYLFKRFDMFINGGTSVFNVFILQLSWLFSYNRKNYIKDMVLNSESGFLVGCNKSWSYKEVREKENYLEVADELLPNRFQIIYYNFVIFFIPYLYICSLYDLLTSG